MFDGQTVLITGAASGFGALAARRFAEQGARLALSDIVLAPLEALAEELRGQGAEVLTDRLDVTREADWAAHVARVVETFGTLDVAINNAGMGHDLAPLHTISVEAFDACMAVNARGVFLGMKHQLPVMRQAGRGVILNVASAAGLVGAGQLSAYAAAKHAVVGLTRSAADENAKKGVRINALCPSFSATPLFDDMADQVGARTGISREDAYERIAARVPMGRVSQPEEVVPAMLFLCARENSFMTGQAVAVDGGLSAV
ncbi:NAD(P)-dependent dehydrogenase, short-chain alcohol dehydrogenase family [Salinihabitans flavidus]|uniref:NAD(P)-dependent dehydrogenase, short-chain alcohol dehydrogenase family n=1 Tax=Salinihabitans flavidus TaxID=569882 RepID=A0A1H8TS30_9RHOB|nr:SDR family NAD(P)-dependent oxidoreductase [Salinihabitans flavidus]SEO93646.1 NAD(P)-dependent dehydrogenase, short-chain alcohol dehydrogenase family [Salinihabitans flavidus]